MLPWHPPPLYEERLRPSGRSWWWLAAICVVAIGTGGLWLLPIAVLAWFVNFFRFLRTRIKVDAERIWVGRRSVRLQALDPATVGRATNPRPWRVFSPRYLGGNPFWTRDSLGIKGRDGTKKVWVSVGTNRREELTAVLLPAVAAAHDRVAAAAAAYTGQPLPVPGWYPAPDDPMARCWWDGTRWTAYRAPGAGATP